MDGVGTPIIGRPRPLPRHDTPNPAYHPHTLNYEEPVNSQADTCYKLVYYDGLSMYEYRTRTSRRNRDGQLQGSS